MARCDICDHKWRGTTLKWVCERCIGVAKGVASDHPDSDGQVVVMPRSHRPFRQIFVLSLLVAFALIGETLILVFH